MRSSSNPVAQSTNPQIVIYDTTGQGLTLPSACGWLEIHQFSQAGPVIPIHNGCAAGVVQVAPFSSYTWAWDQIDGATGQPVPPGRYWIRTDVATASGATVRDWYSVDVVASGTATRTIEQLGPAQIGFEVPFWVVASDFPGASYATLLSFDQNAPLSVPGVVDLAISAPVFVIDSGVLGSGGSAPWLRFPIPNDPALAFTGFHVQALIVDAALVLHETDAESVLIRP